MKTRGSMGVSSWRRLLHCWLAIPLLLIACVGCTPFDETDSNTLTAIMVLDMAGLGDRGFNDAGWAGMQLAVDSLGVDARLIQSSEQSDYVPNLALAAQQADVVVAMGFLLSEAVAAVAPQHPDTRFVFVDGEVPGQNIASFDFRAQEGGFLAGILAAGVTETGSVGCVMGMDIPPVRAYETGFRAGIKLYNASQGADVQYSSMVIGDFNDPARGKSQALSLIAQGCDVVLQLAGNSGLGVIEAFKDGPPGRWAIGADLDQDDLAPGRVLTSILKRIDVAVFEAIRQIHEGRFQSGHHWLGLMESATDLTEMRHTADSVPPEVLTLLDRCRVIIQRGGTIPFHPSELATFDPALFLK